MKNLIVRFASLYVFDVVVLLVIGWLTPARVGLHALWAAVILTLAALFLKPLLTKAATSLSASGTKFVQYLAVFAVELVVWILTVWLSGVTAGNVWGWILPPVILLIGWVVYDQVDDALSRKAGELYDAAGARISGSRSGSRDAGAASTASTSEARTELDDGLTPEQRRMFDELG
ncbi:hypothetical protein RL72_00727 [Microbacterium azadirachtae]|uniref:Uncharacterized protein n=1 Tax=Microbacterium azadirachtae TaxID=582680 RepID=A0A0F0L1I0_9MICO|nr:hypothetical protein [Microbacterium azadirachtae]KJL26988.1 hypothetical protein RL72_00727 [Microbacterium azadirachtae]